ncbi:hypothetical protein Q5530_05460 [Saccharothrix sp. BKS2]|uniref:hypothetical protein n=1 Tax=Saccharothrix sp. BKS2 TaxID=3064400 RepID=UPI0039EB7BAA
MRADREPTVVRHPLHRPPPGFRTCRPHVPPDERGEASGLPFPRAPIEDRFARLVRSAVAVLSAPLGLPAPLVPACVDVPARVDGPRGDAATPWAPPRLTTGFPSGTPVAHPVPPARQREPHPEESGRG